MEGRGLDWTDLSQNRDRWRAVVNTVIYLGFYKMRENFW